MVHWPLFGWEVVSLAKGSGCSDVFSLPFLQLYRLCILGFILRLSISIRIPHSQGSNHPPTQFRLSDQYSKAWHFGPVCTCNYNSDDLLIPSVLFSRGNNSIYSCNINRGFTPITFSVRICILPFPLKTLLLVKWRKIHKSAQTLQNYT